MTLQERLILAGFGDDKPDNTTVPLHLVESYDQECHEMARKVQRTSFCARDVP